MPYIRTIRADSNVYNQFPAHHRHNVWIVTIDDQQPINVSKVISIIDEIRQRNPPTKLMISISKRHPSILTKLQETRAVFQQARFHDMVPEIAPQAQAVIVSSPIPPKAPTLYSLPKSEHAPHWMQSLHQHFEKMYNSGSCSVPCYAVAQERDNRETREGEG